jgi:VCBS repeat-containing protein
MRRQRHRSGQLAAGQTAEDSFEYTVQDADGARSAVSVAINGADEPTTAVALAPRRRARDPSSPDA